MGVSQNIGSFVLVVGRIVLRPHLFFFLQWLIFFTCSTSPLPNISKTNLTLPKSKRRLKKKMPRTQTLGWFGVNKINHFVVPKSNPFDWRICFHHSLVNPSPIGSMVLLYMVTWIPSIYPLYVSINIPAPWIRHGLYIYICFHHFHLQSGHVIYSIHGASGSGPGWWIPNGSGPGRLHEALEQQRTHHDGCSGGCECPQFRQEKYLVGKLT